MYCANCGTSNPDTASICANCGRSLAPTPTPPPPPTGLGGGSYTPPVSPGGYTPPPPAPGGYTPPPGGGFPPGGGYTPGGPPPGSIPNYLVWSIIVSICCCPISTPFGIVSIIFGAQVNSKLAAGDVAGAMAASRNAKIWLFIALGIGLVAMVLSFIFNGAALLEGFRDGAFNS